MTQTQHTTRSCSSSTSRSDLQYAQQRRRRQTPMMLSALLLVSFGIASAAAAVTAQARSSRTQRQVNYDAVAAPAVEEESGCCGGSAATATASFEPTTLMQELGNLTEAYDGSSESSKDVKRSVSNVPMAKSAVCSPQPTVVDLMPLLAQLPGHSAFSEYQPKCTRINRCNGCCDSALTTCQPRAEDIVEMRVRKKDRVSPFSDRAVSTFVIVQVESHTSCGCLCRVKAEDCSGLQVYNKDLCRCECQNRDARAKCEQQTEQKKWDKDNCTCVCENNQSCTTGTVFDETLCKCTDPYAPIDFVDRRRFFVAAVPIEPDNSTLYSV